MNFNIKNFKSKIANGFLHPYSKTYGYIDAERYDSFQKVVEWRISKIEDTFRELKNRMSSDYYRDVAMAQSCAMDYAALHFPAYSFLITEDLADDWLAIVDFHKKHARDHSLHQPLTAYVAAELLGYGDADRALKIPVDPYNLLDFCVNAILTKPEAAYILESAKRYGLPDNMLEKNDAAREFWKGLFYQTVILSALFHDVGYPWQYVDRVGATLRKNVSRLHVSGKLISQIIGEFKDRMLFLPLRNYQMSHLAEPVFEEQKLISLTSAAMETHGFPGAVAFLTLNDAVRKSVVDEPIAKIHQFSVEWASMGIFMHDMEGMHKKRFPKLRLSFTQDPLSSLVSFADYLEEFNRPKAVFTLSEEDSKIKYETTCSDVELEVTADGIMKVGMTYKDSNSKAIASAFKNAETEDYFNPSIGYIDMSSIGIKRVDYYQGGLD